MTDTRELVDELRYDYERWCRENCSPGGASSEFYWRLYKAGAQFFFSRLAAAEKDAGRYRWLRSAESTVMETCTTPIREGLVFMEGDVLDAAIDAARSEGGKP